MINNPDQMSTTVVTTEHDRSSLLVTIYNSNLALVQDERRVVMPAGNIKLEYQGVSGLINSSSALLDGAEGLTTQTFSYDLLNMESLFQAHLGEKAKITDMRGSALVTYDVEIMAIERDSVVIKRCDTGMIGVVPMVSPELHFDFSSVPQSLKATPTLSMNVRGNDETSSLSLIYLTGGLSWNADYVAEISSKDKLTLKALVTLNNQSKVNYNNATVRLLAGDVNQAYQDIEFEECIECHDLSIDFDSAAAPELESLSGYYMYTLPFAVDVRNNEQRQALLFEANSVDYERELRVETRVESRFETPAKMYLTLKNSKETGLGTPMPAGVFRVYQRDKRGYRAFVGEQRINHTGEMQHLEIELGESFDVKVEHLNIDTETIDGKQEFHQGWEITNGSDEKIVLNIYEQGLGRGRRVTFESSDVEPLQVSDGEYLFVIEVPAKSNSTFTYQATAWRR